MQTLCLNDLAHSLIILLTLLSRTDAVPFKAARDSKNFLSVAAPEAQSPLYLNPSTLTFSTSPSSSDARETILSASTAKLLQEGSPPAPSSSSNPKYVVAHHIVGNTYPYTIETWANDIALAYGAGIDAFALNVGVDDWQPQRVADAYQAALQSNTSFKLFVSLDMSSLPCASPSNAQLLRTYVLNYTSHPSQLKYSNRSFVSTFAGESCQFGSDSVMEGWKLQFAQHPDLSGAIYFVPSFFIDPSTFVHYAGVIDGAFNWNSGWPIEITTSFALTHGILPSPSTNMISAETLIASNNSPSNIGANATLASLFDVLSEFIGSTDPDIEYVNAVMPQGSTYMAAVSPWFFTHYSPQTYNKNFIYLSDQHLYVQRWVALIENRDKIDLVEILTWNDYGESHYIGPIEGSQPNSQAWVDGFDHTAWLNMTSYYAAAFKTGVYPPITQDKIYMWARPHPANATSPDPIDQPANFAITQDALWAVVMATAPATVKLSTAPLSQSPPDLDAYTFQVPIGLSKFSIPLQVGGSMYGSISRNDQVVAEATGNGFVFEGNPQVYNFNAFVVES